MSYIVNAVEMRCADETTITHFGVPQLVLMERAALAARDFILRQWPQLSAGGARILIAVGNGNNGGDGAALARLFYLQGHRVTVLVSGNAEKYSSALKSQMEILERYRSEAEKRESADGRRALYIVTDVLWQAKDGQEREDYDLVVDALFGIGLSRPVDGLYREKIQYLNRLSGRKAALDIPSGISAQDGRILGVSFRADLTVTFGFLKTGMLLYPGRELCGGIKVAEIGITAESFLGRYPAGITFDRGDRGQKERLSAFLHREKNSHKGSYGKVLLFAGSAGAPGAALLAGKAVLKSGAGMLQLVSSAENRELTVSMLPEAMYQAVSEHTVWENLLDWCDVVVIGPGLGQDKAACDAMEKILMLVSEEGAQKPIILDADGLNLAAASEKLSGQIKTYTASGGIVIMTPHMAEFARLSQCTVGELSAERMKKTEDYVRESGVILVSKDAATVVCYADEAKHFHYYINQTGNNGMATAGCGDVLAGIVGAFAALAAVRLRTGEERYSSGEGSAKAAYFEAVCLAVCLHGLAGDRAAGRLGEVSMTAGDIVRMLPGLFLEYTGGDGGE